MRDQPHPRLSIVVPTYREAANLPVLIERIDRVLHREHLSAEIIIVDDDSGDGTEACCQALAQNYPLRLIVRRTERGLSSAVVAGMEQARGNILIVMDADLSHPPEAIPALAAALEGPDTDFVIGSRYVAGASTASNWGLFRWLNSRVATLLARPLSAARDPLAGFFALRRALFLQHAAELNPVGYKIGLELMVKCGCHRVVEVPIAFEERLHGTSKLTLREQWNYLSHLGRLYEFRWRMLVESIHFAAVGMTGLAVDLAMLSLCSLAMRPEIARAIAIWVAMTWNFFGNRWLTFARRRGNDRFAEYLRFCSSCLLGAMVNWMVTVAVWFALEGGLPARIVGALAGALAGMGFNFFISRRWVFRGDTVHFPQAPAAGAADDSQRMAA